MLGLLWPETRFTNHVLSLQDKKNIEKHKEEKPKIDPPNTHLTNGHTSPLKNNTKNAPNKNHRRVDSEVTGDKPIKRVIVQEDIRPSIPKDTTKREKGIHKGHGQRFARSFFSYLMLVPG